MDKRLKRVCGSAPTPRALELPGGGREPGPGGSQPPAGEAGRTQGARPAVQLPRDLQDQRGTLRENPH